MSEPNSWRHSRSKRAQAAAIPALVWPVIEFLGGTYTWKTIGAEYRDRLETAHQRVFISNIGLYGQCRSASAFDSSHYFVSLFSAVAEKKGNWPVTRCT